MPAKSLQSCPMLCQPMNCSPPGSSVHGILQARIFEWVAMISSRGIFPTQGWNPVSPGAPDLQAHSLLLSHQGSPKTALLRYWYTMQFTIESFQINVFVCLFLVYLQLFNHHNNQFWNTFYHPKRNFMFVSSHSPFLPYLLSSERPIIYFRPP